MSQNIHQIFVAHPASTLQSTDLFYLGRSPYNVADDFATQWSTILSYFPGSVVTNVTGTSAALVANQSFVANNVGLVTLTLPATAAFGTVIEVIGQGAGGWLIAQNAGQQILVGKLNTSSGAGGSVASSDAGDTIRLMCISANTLFRVLSGVTAAYTLV